MRLIAMVAAAAIAATAEGGQTTLRPQGVVQLEGGARQSKGAGPVASGSATLAPVPVTQLDQHAKHADLDGSHISLSFAEPTSIRDILMLLVRDTRLSVIPDPSLDQQFVGDLKNVTVREALDLILEPLGLDYSIRGNVIRVFPRELETRLYSIDYVITQRTGSRSLNASTGAQGGAAGTGATGGVGVGGTGTGGGVSGGGGSSASVSGSDAPNLYADLLEGVRNLLSPDGRVNIDRTAALLQVTDRPSRLEQIEQYLDAVLLRATRQVQIEAKVIEVTLNDQYSAGINWNAVLGTLGKSVNVTQTLAPATSGGLTMALDLKDFTALINAFSTQGKVNVLSSPRVTAMNNEPAIMRIGTQDVFFVTTTQVNPATGEILQSAVTPQMLTEGVVLSVTPQISADGIIHMSLNPSITERTGVAISRLGDQVPIVSVRETDTLVRVHQGETVVIAGLMQDRTTTDTAKTPVLGDLPVVGGLFRRTEKQHAKTDLVILLTPTLLGPGEVAANTSREIQRLDRARQAADKSR
jgi:MSHA biogenesis protein MshL